MNIKVFKVKDIPAIKHLVGKPVNSETLTIVINECIKFAEKNNMEFLYPVGPDIMLAFKLKDSNV